jgi:hypothetical protein
LISRPNILSMPGVVISEDARSVDLAALALAFSEIVQLPVTMRSAKYPGVRVEKGKVLDDRYSGPVLEEALLTGKSIRTTPKEGAYRGIPVSVAPIMIDGQAVAAVGIVDVMGTIEIPEVFGAYEAVIKQVSGKAPAKK